MDVSKLLSFTAGYVGDTIRGASGRLAWGPMLQFSKYAILQTLSQVQVGQLIIKDGEATYGPYGKAGGSNSKTPDVKLVVQNDSFWVRLLLFADMGFAESYMLGEVHCNDLVQFFELFIQNRQYLSNGTTYTSTAMSVLNKIAAATNSLANTKLNISAHYDISNEMFASFLSPDMTYSCALWAPKDSLAETETLEEAQLRKLRRFITNTKIKSTDHVLEIGTGWGSFAIEAVHQTGCRVTSLTLSVEQKALADKRIAAAGFSNRITVVICDYRALPAPNPKYDKLVSIEMLEAVGGEYLETYFECVDRLLKPDGGIAAFQCITMPELRHADYQKSQDFIRKYIFPGGYLPTTTELISSITAGSRGTLIVESVQNIGGHYSRTLRLWREEFLRNFELRILPALKVTYPDLDEAGGLVFKRKWEYYFAYCEAGFKAKTLGDVIITVAREGTTDLLEDIPM